MEFFVDRELPVPLRTQLQGLIEYGIACGELAPGEILPSVRELAEKVGVAPMTVSQVYVDANGNATVNWSRGLNIAPLTYARPNVPRIDMFPARSCVA